MTRHRTHEVTEERSRAEKTRNASPQPQPQPHLPRCAARSIAPRSSAHRHISSSRRCSAQQRAPICPVRCSICASARRGFLQNRYSARRLVRHSNNKSPRTQRAFADRGADILLLMPCRLKVLTSMQCRRGLSRRRRHRSFTHARTQHSSLLSAPASALSPQPPGHRPPARPPVSSTPYALFASELLT